MLRSIKELQGFSIRATDGDIGKVHDVYFDSESSMVRYIVVDTGPWLIGKKVLVSPVALHEPDWEAEALPVELTKDQVKDSPDWRADRPISRQDEVAYHDHFRWPYYWGSAFGGYTSGGAYLGTAPMADLWGQYATRRPEMVEREDAERAQDSKLHSAREVIGYDVEAEDGEVGKIDDLLLDDESWTVSYLVVETRGFRPGEKVLISPEWIDAVDWQGSHVHVDVTCSSMETAPEYEPDMPPDKAYERRLFEHYGRERRWASTPGRHR
jgi:sporulation protein YlmC with PRC-barrel domain